MAEDHEFRYAQLARQLEIDGPERIASYLYPNVVTKARLTGARTTNVAPVWLRRPQVHVLLTAYEWRLRPEEFRYQPWVDGQVAKVERGLAALEQTGLVLSGPLNAARIAAGCALGYVDFRLADLGWRDRCPILAAWYAEFAATPAMKATVPVG